MTLYGDDNKDEKKPFMQHRQKVGEKKVTQTLWRVKKREALKQAK